ncbi:MAG: OmpA family protein [Azospirillum sp.]|nr:OmpA family protein [Azospirillum sp.]
MLAASAGFGEETRDYVSIVAPRSVYPYVSTVIGEYGNRSRFKFPRIGTTDVDVAIKLLCAGAGVDLPDIALANRKMTDGEAQRCQRNGVTELVDMKIGFDAIAMIGGKNQGPTELRAADLFLAVAEKIPDPTAQSAAGAGDSALPVALVANPYHRWNEVNPELPDLPIRFMAPPRSSLYWSIFSAGLLEVGCRQIKPIAAMEKPDPAGFQKACQTLRSDDAVAEAPDDFEKIAAALNEQPGTLAVMRLTIARKHGDRLHLLPIDGVVPSVETVNDSRYKPSQPVYLFVKQSNFEIIPGLRDFVSEFIGPRATGESGYLTDVGLVPLTEEERRQVRALVSTLVAPEVQAEPGDAGSAQQAPAARLRELEASLWDSIKGSKDPTVLKIYLDLFKGGLFARSAEGRVERYANEDADKDGVPDYLDQCPKTAKGIKVDKAGCPVDSDGDGVTDDVDPCPNTVKEAKVDRLGCPLDADRDGVPDYLDKCADTPAGIAADEQGCPKDADRDRIPDSIDDCPDTPDGFEVDSHGCPLDADRDGVPDHIDKCADTPAGIAVDEQGCPKDADGDHVADSVDDCPNTPEGVEVDKHGCPLDQDHDGVPDYLDKCNVPQWGPVDETGCLKDEDGDGVADDRDQCPNTPKGTPVDLKGCEISVFEPDEDKDGTPDSRDKCPGTPAGTRTDNLGCPVDSDGDGVNDDKDECPGSPKGVKVDEKGCWTIEKLLFGPTEGEILLKHAAVLQQVLDVMRKNPALRLEIRGHSDSGGDPGANVWYATRRALSTAQFFMANGINQDRLVVKGLGADQPAAPNDSQANRQLNRRVEIFPIPIQ